MMMTPKALAALAALFASGVQSHMIMANPKPFGHPDNSPLSSSGQNFPCKTDGTKEFFAHSASNENKMVIGETQKLSFSGSAVHGGGSCQLALTSDENPTASSEWQVIMSIEGGCPSKDGSGPSEYDFKIPESIKPGYYVFAWTWISKLAGQPEYYMNCAPVQVSGGNKRRSYPAYPKRADTSALPNLFVANLASVNQCKTEPSTDPLYPDPGPNVMKPNPNAAYKAVTGTNCFPKGGSSSGGNNGGTPPPPASSAAAGPASSKAAAPPASSKAAGMPTGTVPANGMPTHPAASSPAATSPASPPPASSPASPPVMSTPAASPMASTPASTGGSGGGLSGACQSEGMWNCIGGNSFQRCASGMWSPVTPMAGGMTCKEGQTMSLWRREAGFQA